MMPWPNTVNLSLKWWSIRNVSSVKLVGAVTPLMNCVPLVGAGKIPCFNSSCAFASSRLEGMVLFGKGTSVAFAPLQFPVTGSGVLRVNPAAVNLEAMLGATWLLHGTCNAGPPDISPLYHFVSGTVWLMTPFPNTYLRHSML